MCRQLVLLAKNDFRQMIFTCEHGTIHITHQHTTLCLGRANFLDFAQWFVNRSQSRLHSTDTWRVQETADEQVELWLGSGGLHLTLAEYFAFIHLLRITLERLETFQRSRSRLPVHLFKADPSLN